MLHVVVAVEKIVEYCWAWRILHLGIDPQPIPLVHLWWELSNDDSRNAAVPLQNICVETFSLLNREIQFLDMTLIWSSRFFQWSCTHMAKAGSFDHGNASFSLFGMQITVSSRRLECARAYVNFGKWTNTSLGSRERKKNGGASESIMLLFLLCNL